MKATIVNFRSSSHRQKYTHLVLKIDGIDSRERANHLVGKTVIWTSPTGKEIKGKIAAAHGNKGAVRAIFEKGMPGQAVGAEVVVS